MTTADADIPALVRQLRSSSRMAQLRAAKVAFHLTESGGEAVAGAMVEAGGVPPLLGLLGGGSGTAQLAAAWALFYLADASQAAREAICAANGVAVLVCLLGSSSSAVSLEVLRRAAFVLKVVTTEEGPDPVPAIVAAGGIPVLVSLLSREDEMLQAAVAGAISAMAAPGTPATLQALLHAGAVPAVARCLLSGSDPLLLYQAAGALANLVRQEDDAQAAAEAAEAGTLPALLGLLDSSDGSQLYYESAACAVCNICLFLGEGLQQEQQQLLAWQTALVAAGAVPAASRLLERQGSPTVQQAGAAVIGLLVCRNEAMAAELAAAGSVQRLLDMDREDTRWVDTVTTVLRHLVACSPEATASLEKLCQSEHERQQLASLAGFGPPARCDCKLAGVHSRC